MIERIYYADQEILDIIKTDFTLIDDKSWYQLYQHKIDKTFWRLDKWDKYQKQIFVQIDKPDNWIEFDDKELRIELLLKTRGLTCNKCIWKDCDRLSLQGLVYCERHAYEEMGIRR
jgi:hypothetical protein